MEYIAYDIEVFKEDYIVVFKDLNKNIKLICHNSNNGIEDIIKSNILISYNGYYYDDKILTAIIAGQTPHQIKHLNDRLIGGEKINRVNPKINSLDCFQQINVSRPSLKKIEGNFGKSIIESSIPFDLNRKLTDEELQETIKYCSYDVDTTIDVFKIRNETYFKPKKILVDMLDENSKNFAKKWNTTTIGANVLTNKVTRKWSDIRLGETYIKGENEVFKIFDLVPYEAVSLWTTKNKGKYTHKEFGCNIEFSFGGLHGVPEKEQRRYKNIKLLDVASLYPNIIIKLNALGLSTEKYKEIVDKRLSVKHTNKKLSDALKLIINSCYGLLNNKYSMLYNPNAAKSVCIYGQCILYDLCKRLSNSCEIININTDGVGFIPKNDDYIDIWKEWEDDYGFTLELSEFDLWIQKDVNNYIAVKDNDIKVKGGDVGKYKKDNYFANNNLRIVDIAVVEHLVYGKDILDIICEKMDSPKLFQIVLQAGGTYKGTFDEHGKQYNKINRIFPIKNGGITLYKKRMDNGLVRFPDTPDHMYVYNYDLDNFNNFKEIIDINFYYKLINKVLERWV